MVFDASSSIARGILIKAQESYRLLSLIINITKWLLRWHT